MKVTAPLALFVYGSLRRGGAYHHLLGGSPAIAVTRTAPGFELFDLGAYPAMVRGGSGSVEGELYAIETEVLAVVDELEGHPRYYRRARVRLAGGEVAFAYLLRRAAVAGRERITSGRWSVGRAEAG